MIYVGVDIGVTGAVAMIEDRPHVSLQLTLWDMPVVAVGKGAKRYDPRGILSVVIEIDNRVQDAGEVSVLWEQCHHKYARTAMSFGLGMGIWTAMSTVRGWRQLKPVTPQSWQKHYRLSGLGKGASRLLAQGWFPEADLGARSSQDRAEATILAMYCRHLMWGGQ